MSRNRCKTPVIVLSDQALGQAHGRDRSDRRAAEAAQAPHQRRAARHAVVQALRGRRRSDRRAMPLPGTPGYQWVAEGLTHNETGIAGERRGHARRPDQQARQEARSVSIPATMWGETWGEGDTAVLAFGSTVGPAREAARRLAGAGHPVRVIALRVLSPLPMEAIARALDGVRRIIVIEQNHGAQLYHHLIGHKAIPPSAESVARPGSAAVPARRRSPPMSCDGTMTMNDTMTDTRAARAHRAMAAKDFPPARIRSGAPAAATSACSPRSSAASPSMAARRTKSCWSPASAARRGCPPIRVATASTACTAAPGGGRRPQADAARSRGDRGRRRRRRLLDRRQSFHPRLPAQRRHALSGHGQPRLRHDQGPAVADHRAGLGQRHRARRHRAAAVQSDGDSRSPPARISSRADSPATRTVSPI